MSRIVLPGKPYPLGATLSTKGTNFALFSKNATAVSLCFFDDTGAQTDCISLTEKTAFVWHGLIRGIQAGQRYGYRVEGPWQPEAGHRFNPAKLLIDPYARAISGSVDYKAPIFPYDNASGDDLKRDDRDSAAGVPRSVVVDSHFDWGSDAAPDTALSDSVIYEMNVRGFSIRNSAIPEALRGTYAGLACEASITYLKQLGVTAVELLPVHHFIDEGHLVDRNLRDYWGYNSLGYFAPMPRYSASGDMGGQVIEFKEMVKSLHAAGIEVILDVVYNHTCEGNEKGPMLSMKGIDNLTYYKTVPDKPRFYNDFTGTGNTLNVVDPEVLKLVMGFTPLLGHRDARRWLPLRSCQHAGASVAGGFKAFKLLRRHPSGPYACQHQAHRGAVGCGQWRLPGRQLPCALGGVERQVPRYRATLLEG